MQLIDLYVSFKNGDISEDEFATGLGVDVSSLRHRMTLAGATLPMKLTILDAISNGSMTRLDASKTLGISTRGVNKLMESWKVQRPIGVSRTERTMTAVKRTVQLNAAIDYISGRRDLLKAAEDAHLSDRQMRRWVAQMLDKHVQMTWGEFHDEVELRVEDAKKPFKHQKYQESAQEWRENLAKRIRKAVSIEGEKEDLARRISAGKESIESAAVDIRVAQRRGAA